MGRTVNVNNPQMPAKKEPKNPTVADFISSYKDRIAMVLPKTMTPERFTRIAINAVSNTPELAKCTPQSLISALLKSAECGLEPNTALGEAYLIPYGGKVQFQISYQGQITLAYRANEDLQVEARCVYENDDFEYEFGFEPKLKHVPAMTNRGEVVWVYAIVRIKGRIASFEVMSRDDINRHRRQYSKARTSPWDTAWEEMAKKTVLKKALKYIPKSAEMATALEADEHTMDIDLNSEAFEPIIEENNVVEADYTVDEDGVIDENESAE